MKAWRRSITAKGPLYSVVLSASALSAGDQDFQIVTQLPGGELIAFEIGGQPALAIDYQGMQRVRQVAFLRPEIQSELARNRLHIVEWPGEEVPRLGIGLPGGRVFCQYGGLVM